MRVLFMGGKAIGRFCLDILLTFKEDIVAVIPNENSDVLLNRWYPSITQRALDKEIPVISFKNLKEENTLNKIKELNPDIIVVAYYDKILPKEIVENYYCINVHMAPAEQYRGCYPTTWAIINGDFEYGITIHKIDTGIDSGDILAECKFDIERGSLTGKELYNIATNEASNLFYKFWNNFKNNPEKIKPRKQITDTLTEKHDRNFPNRNIFIAPQERHKIMAYTFPPFPPPYTIINGRKFIIIPEEEDE